MQGGAAYQVVPAVEEPGHFVASCQIHPNPLTLREPSIFADLALVRHKTSEVAGSCQDRAGSVISNAALFVSINVATCNACGFFASANTLKHPKCVDTYSV